MTPPDTAPGNKRKALLGHHLIHMLYHLGRKKSMARDR